MKGHSNKLSDCFEYASVSRGRSNNYKPSIPRLRSGSSALNISSASNTTECSILKMQDSFSVTGKPPRVPLLKTIQVKQKEKEKNETIFLDIDDEKFYISEYR